MHTNLYTFVYYILCIFTLKVEIINTTMKCDMSTQVLSKIHILCLFFYKKRDKNLKIYFIGKIYKKIMYKVVNII